MKKLLLWAGLAGLFAPQAFSQCGISLFPPNPIYGIYHAGVGTPYDGQVVVSGATSPYSFAVTSGALPDGLTLGASTGRITGVPTREGTFAFTIQLSATASTPACTTSASFSLIVGPAPVITPDTLPSGTVGTAYNTALGATHPASTGLMSFGVIAGALPPGLTILTTQPPAIAGTPTTTGTYTFTLRLSLMFGSSSLIAQKQYTMTITPATVLTVSPTSVALQAQVGGPSAVQTVTLTPTLDSATITASTDSGGSWLHVSALGRTATGAAAAANTFQVWSTNQTAGTYTGRVSISSALISNSPVVIPVTLTVAAAPSLGVSTSSLSFNYRVGGAGAPTQVNLTSSQGILTYTAAASTTSGGSWLSVSPASGSTPATLDVLANPAGLAAGSYSGTIQVIATTAISGGTPAAATGSPHNIAVSMTITENAGLAVSPTSLSFTYQTGAAQPAPQALTVTTGSTTPFTVSTSGAAWLSVAPAAGTTPGTVNVSVNAAGLNPGSYNANITIAATGMANSPQTIPVALTVTSTGLLSFSPAALTFNYQVGGAQPAAQSLAVSAAAATTFSAVVSDAPWLAILPAIAATPATLNVMVSTAGLNPGTYQGSIRFTVAGAEANPQTVPVTLAITTTSLITVSNSALSYTYQLSGSLPQPQTVSVTATTPTAFTATAAGGAWLSVTPISGTTPATLSIAVSPAGLSGGVYEGSVTVAVPGSTGTPQTVRVTLTVTGGLAITSTSPLAAGAVATAYSQTLTASGGTSPYQWLLVSGTLPAGLTLSTAGVLAGTPTIAGTYSFTLQVRDNVGATATQAFTLVIGTEAALTRSGVLPHLASGGGWKTTIFLANASASSVGVKLEFHAGNGSSLVLPMTVSQPTVTSVTASLLERVIAPNSTLVIETEAQTGTTLVGWADVLSSGALSGFAIFRQASQSTNSEGTAPLLDQYRPVIVLPYDNTTGYATGIAIANLSGAVSLTATAWDEHGILLGAESIAVAAVGHTSFALADTGRLPVTAGKRGIVTFTAPTGSNLSGLAFRFSPFGTFTSVPVTLRAQ